MASTTTEIPIPHAGAKNRTGSDALEAEAVGLEIGVRIHGSQVAAVVLDTTEHVEPFEEDTTTMIVFPRGAVVKLCARVRTGHAIVLTNLLTKQTALCRIVQVNTAPNVAHYVKIEFIQPVPGFWGVHFPSDPLPSEQLRETPASAPAPPIPAKREAFAEPVSQAKPAQAPRIPAAPIAAKASIPPRTDAHPVAPKPSVHEAAKPALPRELPLTVPSVGYGTDGHGQQEQFLPLASGTPAADRKAANLLRTAVAAPATPKVENRAAMVEPSIEQPIFDSLTTTEDVFSRESISTVRDTSTVRDYSSLLQTGVTPKPPSLIWMRAGAAMIVVALAAGGALYLRHNRAGMTQTTSVAHAASQTAPLATSVTSASATPSPVPAQPRTNSAAATTASNPNSIAASRVPAPQRSAASMSRPVISTGVADIYAGDLQARPQITRSASAVAAPLPEINDPASKEIPGVSGRNALGSLVSGATRAHILAPPPPRKPAPRQGGKVELPKLIKSVAPVYPSLATANHIEGNVKIQAQIDASGRVTSTKVISGPILLRAAAMNAVRQWKYSPAMLDGKPIAAQYAVTVSFRLNQ